MDYTQAKINEFTQFIKDCFRNDHKMCESERFAYFLIRDRILSALITEGRRAM